MPYSSRTRRGFLRDAGLAGAAVSAIPLLRDGTAHAQGSGGPTGRAESVTPIVQENQNNPDTWSQNFQLPSVTAGVVSGFTRKSSVNVGEDVELVLWGPDRWYDPVNPTEGAEIDVYRLGYYGGQGGRLIWSSGGVVSSYQSVGPDGTFQPPAPDHGPGVKPAARPDDTQTGAFGHADLRTSATIPGEKLTVSGVYLIRLRTRWRDYPYQQPSVPRTGDAHVVFIVRDDDRPRDLLVQLPTNTWQAYNYWSGRSLYTTERGEDFNTNVPATQTPRAAKVSFDRPFNNWISNYNWVLRTEFPAIWWLEQQGYDLAYTEDVALTYAPEQLMPEYSSGVAILGHGEYWTEEIRDGLEAARDAGTNIYNFGANTGYWRVRYETPDGGPATGIGNARVMACYKTIEGGGALAPDVASLDDPTEPTTTWRDPGKGPGINPPGTTHATPPAYAGPNRPEAELLGVQYIGNDNAAWRGLTVPADNGHHEFSGHRAWRHTPLYRAPQPTVIDSPLIGWEWDAVPTDDDPFGGVRPPTHPRSTGLKRLSDTDPRANAPSGNQVQYLLDAGRSYTEAGTAAGAAPKPGTAATTQAITYRAPSGAAVFSAGTIQWSWGLGPHYQTTNGTHYSDPRVDGDVDPAIQQATANLLADEGIFPATPGAAIVIDPLSEPDLELPPPEPEPQPEPGPGPDPGPHPGPGPEPAPPAGPPTTTPTGPGPAPPPKQPPTVPGPLRLVFDLTGTRVTRTGRIEGRVRLNQPGAGVAGTVRGTIEFTAFGDRVARGRFTIRSGGSRSTTLRLRLSPWARRYLGRKNELRLTARITITAGEAGPKRTQTRLRVSRAKRR